jgi:hypothetical protein
MKRFGAAFLGLIALALAGSAGAQTISAPGGCTLPGASTLGCVFSKAAVTHQFLNAIVAADGSVTSVQPAVADLSDGSTLALLAGATFTGSTVVSGASFGLSGNISASGIFGTTGIRYKNAGATLNDTTSSGTIAAAYTDVWGGNTLTATSATTITQQYGSYFNTATCSTNVTCTNKYALGADSISTGYIALPSYGFIGTGLNGFGVLGTGETAIASGTSTGFFLLTGSGQRDLVTAPYSAFIFLPGGSGSNVAGGNLTIRPGVTTGSGTAGSLILATSFQGVASTGTATFTNSSANIGYTNSFAANQAVQFTSSGTLPTNFALATTYYVIATGLSGSNIQVSATMGGAAITAGSAGSGTQTLVTAPVQQGSVAQVTVATSGVTIIPAIIAGGSAPALTGTCTTSTQVGGNTAGSFAATCTAQTVILTFATTAPHGYVCNTHDITTVADVLNQTATSTTSCTVSGTTVASDVILFNAVAY